MPLAHDARNSGSPLTRDPIPRMVGERDIAQVAEVASSLTPSDVAVEFGPWLGALSVEIAPHAHLHVVDSFEWTKSHDERAPGLMKPGGSFRSILEKNLSDRGLSATVHETSFAEFRWSGDRIDLLVVDGPKKATDLADCLRSTVGCLRLGGRVLIKNALHPVHWELAALMWPLIAEGILRFNDTPIAPTSNVLELIAGPNADRAEARLEVAEIRTPVTAEFFEEARLPSAHPYRLAPILHRLKQADYSGAYAHLSEMKPERRLQKAWEKHSLAADDDQSVAIFSSVFSIHHTAFARKPPEPIGPSSERLIRGAWLNMAALPDRGNRFQPDLMEQARHYGYMGWPNKIRTLTYGKRILDLGCGPGLHGLGYIASGAASYLGIDPIIRVDRDWVKNLSAGERMEFGWTPKEISARIDAWEVLPICIEELPDERKFDLAILHNVTEHLINIEQAFEEIVRHLREGGHILYNHDNFYSWNGHHCPPKKIEDIDPSDPRQLELVDWGHLDFEPPPDHYISRGLNRIKLDDLIDLTKRYFSIEQLDEVPSTPATGSERLNEEILARHPQYTRRDLSIKNLFCVARRN